jgi:hypothetical protein
MLLTRPGSAVRRTFNQQLSNEFASWTILNLTAPLGDAMLCVPISHNRVMMPLAIGKIARSLRGYIVAWLLLNLAAVLAPMTASAKPLVPLLSFLQHWDHHWYAWLPGDPVYEAVEVMATERSGQEPLVWVFFTERAPPKNQINYYNDTAAVTASRAGGRVSYFVPMGFAVTGNDGAPLGVAVAFDDAESRRIDIEIGVDDGAKLSTTGSGLTNQIGHSSAHTLLIFFREQGARTQQARVRVAGVDMTKPQAGMERPIPFVAAYSRNIYTGGFPFYGAAVSFEEAARSPGPVISFHPASGSSDYESRDGQRLVTTGEGALQAYQQQDRSRAHRLDVRFEPPLPPVERLAAGEASSHFTVSLDGFANLISGEVIVHHDDNAATLDWRFDAPAWTRAWRLLTTATIGGDAVTRIELKPMPPK